MATAIYRGKDDQVGYPDLAWRNFAMGSLVTRNLGSGVAEATFFAGAGILKAVGFPGVNEAGFVVIVDGNNLGSVGSAGLTDWGVLWKEFSSEVVIRSGTAQNGVSMLIGTGLPPFTWA